MESVRDLPALELLCLSLSLYRLRVVRDRSHFLRSPEGARIYQNSAIRFIRQIVASQRLSLQKSIVDYKLWAQRELIWVQLKTLLSGLSLSKAFQELPLLVTAGATVLKRVQLRGLLGAHRERFAFRNDHLDCILL